MFDGFIREFCSLISEESYDVSGIRLLSGIYDIYSDTAAVFDGLDKLGEQQWSAYVIGMEGRSTSDSFYSLNGYPVFLKKEEDNFICVEPQSRMNKQVCRFFANENKHVWVADRAGTKIKVMQSCNPEKVGELNDYTLQQIKEHRCYDILGKNVCKWAANAKISQFLDKIFEKRRK